MMNEGMSPFHPGSILSGMIEGFIEESGQHYSMAEIAQGLGVTRTTLSVILHKKSGISPSVKRQDIPHFIINKSSIFSTKKAS